MKKWMIGFGVAWMAAMCLAGCQNAKEAPIGNAGAIEEEEQEQVTKLVWQSSQLFRKHEAYFNQVLKEKGLPYEVEFLDGDMTMEGQAIDLREITWTWLNPYDITEEILKGRFLALDGYLDSEAGKVIKDSLPETVWDAYKVDGTQYTVLSAGFLPTKTVYIWDTKLAEKYDLHPEDWNGNIWEYEDGLRKVCEGEKEDKAFVTVEGARLYAQYLAGMTQALGSCYPFAVRESDVATQAELLYETPEYLSYAQGMQSLLEQGIYDPDKEENPELDVKSFLKIETDFKTKEAYLAWQPDDFWDTHEVKEIRQQPLWRLSVCAAETGITTESEHPDEAFGLLCKLYEDADLINALMWGKEGKDYELRGNTAVRPAGRDYIPACYVGNNFLSYAEVGQDPNKKDLYPKWLSECEDSKLKGFEFSGKACEEELQKVSQISREWEEKGGDTILKEREALVQEYKQAGADRIIEEWNRQYREWSGKADPAFKQPEGEEETLVWKITVPEFIDIWQKPLNRLLKEKGASYRVKIEAYDTAMEGPDENAADQLEQIKQDGGQVDVIAVPNVAGAYTQMADRGLLFCLDDFLESEKGDGIRNAVPARDLARCKYNGATYGISAHLRTVGAVAYDKALLKKYGIDVSELSPDIFENEAILQRIKDGEGGKVIPYAYNEGILYGLGMWKVDPVECLAYTKDGKAVNLFETNELREKLFRLKELKDKGLLCILAEGAPGTYFAREEMAHREDPFAICSSYNTGDGQELTGEYAVIPDLKRPQIAPFWGDAHTAVASWSKNRENALDFVARLYTDPEIANLILYGNEGEQYTLTGNVASRLPDNLLWAFAEHYTNALIAYPQNDTAADKADFQKRYYEQCEPFIPDGFRFDTAPVAKETEAVNAVCLSDQAAKLLRLNETDIDAALSEMNAKLKDAGIDRIIREFGRQLTEWRERYGT